jgi:uncharacterized protein (UPF0276 family)
MNPEDVMTRSCSLPARAGLGLKPQHFQEVLDTRPDIGFFEVHAENYMVDGGPFHHYLGCIREHYALSLHGVGLSIGSEAGLDPDHLERLASLVERYQPESVSEHLAWSSHGGVFFNDLLPVPYNAQTLQRVCEHVERLQSRLRRRVLIENPSTYVEFEASTLGEGEFLRAVVQRSGCGLLLDVNNAYLSCVNHRRDPWELITALPLGAVGEIHLAGFAVDHDAAGATLLIDTHGAPVHDQVWQLYAQTLARIGPVPTLLERDNQVPSLTVLLQEVQQAQTLLDRQAVHA